METGKIEFSIIEKQYSDAEYKLSHLGDDLDFSKLSEKLKAKNSSSENTQQANHHDNQAYQYPRQTRYHDFRMLQYGNHYRGRDSRKSSTHNDLSGQIDPHTNKFEDFEEEIEAIMSGNESRGSKDSRGQKGIPKRSNTVHISHSSGGTSEHKSSKFFKSKKSIIEL